MNPDERPSINAVIFTRVSKSIQDYQRQIADLTQHAQTRGWKVIQVIAEKITGVKDNDEREGIHQLLELCQQRKIDKVLITEVSRLGRRPSQTHQVLETLTQQQVSIYIAQYNIETLLPTGKLNPAASMIFSITADMARQERETLIERIVSGMAEAKRKGKRFGRSPGQFYSDDELKKKYARPLKDLQQGLSIRKVAKIYGLSADTVQRIKKRLLPPSTPTALAAVVVTELLAAPLPTPIRSLEVSLWLQVENNSSFVRGKKKVRENIENFVLRYYGMRKLKADGWDYTLTIPYQNEEEVDRIIDDILYQANSLADNRHCFIEWNIIALDGSERSW